MKKFLFLAILFSTYQAFGEAKKIASYTSDNILSHSANLKKQIASRTKVPFEKKETLIQGLCLDIQAFLAIKLLLEAIADTAFSETKFESNLQKMVLALQTRVATYKLIAPELTAKLFEIPKSYQDYKNEFHPQDVFLTIKNIESFAKTAISLCQQSQTVDAILKTNFPELENNDVYLIRRILVGGVAHDFIYSQKSDFDSALKIRRINNFLFKNEQDKKNNDLTVETFLQLYETK